MDEKLFMAYLSKTLNMDAQQVAELVKTEDGKEVKSNALELLLNKNSEHIQTLQSKNKPNEEQLTERFNNGYAKGKEEVLGKFETEVKEHYGITADKKGLDLIGLVVAEKSKAAEDKVITADDVKSHSIFINTVQQLNQEKDKAVEDTRTEYQKKIDAYKQKESFSTISHKADEIINKLNPVFSSDPARAQNQRKMIHSILENRQFKINDANQIVPLNKDGNVLENEHGHQVSFEEVVKDVTTGLYDLNKSKDRSSSGGGTEEDDDNAGAKAWTGTPPKNDDEYMKMIANAKTVEEKTAITEAYNEANPD